MSSTYRTRKPLSFLALVAAVGCGAEIPVVEENPPLVLGLSRTQVSIGEGLEIVGGNFLNGGAGHTIVRLDGEYHTKNGPVHAVGFELRPHWEDANRLVWAQFGPFRVPFSPSGDELGTFHGKLTAINILPDETRSQSEPVDIELEVLPSIVIRELHPIDTQCDAPSKVILGGFPYKVSVEAIGFEPVNFSYVVFGEPGVAAPRIIRRQATGNIDSYGDDGDLFFNLVPVDLPFYVGTFAVAALGTDGIERAIGLSYGVHNAIEHVNLRKVRVAEIESAVPVSGCNSGGQTQGRTLTYSEQSSDTRSRTVGVTWNESFSQQASSTTGGSTTETYGINYNISQTETEGWEMGYSSTLGGELGGGVKVAIPTVVEVGLNSKVSASMTNSRGIYGSSTRGYSVGRDYSVSDTESWAFTQTQGHEVSQGGQDFWTISSSETTIVSFQGNILPGEYGVFYRQATRLSLPGAVVAYNLCGVPSVVAETDFYDYTWSVDLAQGDECPPFPESDLPETECFIAPCANGSL
jgi:hypothetical protein